MIRISTVEKNRGFTLFIAVITASIVLAMGMSILNITLKAHILANTVRDSEMAFYAADSGIECALYWDESIAGGKFNATPNPPSTIRCMGANVKTIGGASDKSVGGQSYGSVDSFEVSWGSPAVCAQVSVTKQSNSGGCPAGVVCTTVVSSGYNRACNNLSDPRTEQRRLRTTY